MNSEVDAARLALRCLDLTSLKEDDNEASIAALAETARTPFGAPAALCVYPRWIASARKALDERRLTNVKIVTVVNFPHGTDTAESVAAQARAALASGADEIDVVFHWQAMRAGDMRPGIAVVRAVREHAGKALLKVILEAGELRESALIRQASNAALDAGADFLKTSTGKVPVNATPQAARVMLEAIRDHANRHGRTLAQSAGFKAAGGVATLAEARQYIDIAQEILGAGWATPEHMRFGASGLIKSLLSTLRGDGQNALDATGY